MAPTRKPAKPAPPTPTPHARARAYTPPAPKTAQPSHLWVPVTMFTCLVLGIVVIAGNYLELLPGGEASNDFLLIGLVLLVSGFMLSTFFRVTPRPFRGECPNPRPVISHRFIHRLWELQRRHSTRTMSSRQWRGGSGSSSCAAVIVTSAPQTMHR